MWAALSEGNDVVVGKIEPVGSTVLQRTIGRVQTPARQAKWNRPSILPSSRSIAFSKSQWDAVGGYPEWLRHGQDEAFSRALRSAGAVFRFVPGAPCRPGIRGSPWPVICPPASGCPGPRARPGSSAAAWSPGWRPTSDWPHSWLFPRSTLLQVRRHRRLGRCTLGPYLRRVWRTRAGNPDRLPGRVLATVAVVVGADAGWLAGYPLGLLKGLWAASRRRARPASRRSRRCLHLRRRRRIDRPGAGPAPSGPASSTQPRSEPRIVHEQH